MRFVPMRYEEGEHRAFFRDEEDQIFLHRVSSSLSFCPPAFGFRLCPLSQRTMFFFNFESVLYFALFEAALFIFYFIAANILFVS